MAKSKITTALKAVEADKEDLLERIDESLEKVRVRMRPYEKLKEREQELIAARRALLGGHHATGGGTTRVRQQDIVAKLRENPGLSAQQLADHFGVKYNTLYAHLSRGKDERFLQVGSNWYLRDPKNGISTVEDIERMLAEEEQ